MQLGAIDRADDRPPYRQIADQLRAAIDHGDLVAGDKLPSEAVLIEHYGELLGLRWQDVDFGAATLTVEQTVQRVGARLIVEGAKTEASEATIPLPKVTRKALLAHRQR